MLKDSKCLVDALTEIQAQKAEASHESDKTLIFEVVERSEGGFLHMNKTIKGEIRRWYVEQLQKLANKDPADYDFALTCAEVMQSFGFLDQAAFHAKKCLDRNQESDRANHVMGMIKASKGNYKEALGYHTKSLELRKGLFGEESYSVAVSLQHLGEVHYHNNDFSAALGMLMQALSVCTWLENLEESHSLDTLTNDQMDELRISFNVVNSMLKVIEDICFLNENVSMAKFLRDSEWDTGIEPPFQAAMKELDRSSPVMALAYITLGKVRCIQENYDEAQNYFQQALEITMSVLGETHPSISDIYTGLGDVSFSRGKYEQALKHYEEALRIQLGSQGKLNVDVAMTYFNIAKVDSKLGNHNDALENYFKALEIRTQVFSKKHLQVLICDKVIGEEYAAMGLTEKSLHHQGRFEQELEAMTERVLAAIETIASEDESEDDSSTCS